MSNCQICASKIRVLKDPQIKVEYQICEQCSFTYKLPKYHISNTSEHNQYKLHNNSFESKGYVKIFVDFIEEFIRPLQISRKGLEYGSGPGPVLKELLNREGIKMYDYDPFFNDNKAYLSHTYQLITSTEVIEHFTNPIKEFEHLLSLLEPNGYLALMTNFNTYNDTEFLNWWYRRDETHISFYHLDTFHFLAKKYDLKIMKHNHKNVIIYQKGDKS